MMSWLRKDIDMYSMEVRTDLALPRRPKVVSPILNDLLITNYHVTCSHLNFT